MLPRATEAAAVPEWTLDVDTLPQANEAVNVPESSLDLDTLPQATEAAPVPECNLDVIPPELERLLCDECIDYI